MKEFCNDCKEYSIFKINKDQDAVYYNGKRLKECTRCGRYECTEKEKRKRGLK
tara:strand:- start:67 stop:225 length:159 start_codon:yes stop_codon:yes gene_type:complete